MDPKIRQCISPDPWEQGNPQGTLIPLLKPRARTCMRKKRGREARAGVLGQKGKRTTFNLTCEQNCDSLWE